MSNNASIDLKANPEGVKAGVGEARKAVEKFAEDAEKYFKELGLTSEELEERLKSLRETLTGLAEENEVAAKSGTLLNAELATEGVLLAAGLGLLGKTAAALAVVTTGATLYKEALNSTSEKMTLLDKSLLGSKKLIEASGGDVEKLNAMLAAMGTTAEEQGIKVENAWGKVSKAGDKLFKQMFAGGKIQEETNSWFTKLSQSMRQGWDGFWEREAKNTEKDIDQLTALAKKARDVLARTVGNVLNFSSESGGFAADQDSIADEEKGAEEHRKSEEADKIAQLYKEQHKESIERQEELAKAKQETAAEEREDLEINGLYSIKLIEDRITANQKFQEQLVKENKLHLEIGEKTIATEEKLLARKKEFLAEQEDAERENLEAMLAADAALGNIEKGFKETAKAAYEANLPVIALNELLAVEETRLKELTKLNLLKTNEGITSLERVGNLRQQIHSRTMKDMQTEEDFQVAKLEREFDERVSAQNRLKAIEDSKRASSEQATLQILKAQGATEEVLHQAKMKMLDAELARALDAENDVEKQKDLVAKHEIDRDKLVSEAGLTEELKRYKLAEIGRNVSETKEDAQFKKKMAGLELDGASDKKLHDERMKHIDEEEKRELGKTKSDIEQAAVRAQAEKARIAEKTEFEIREMKRIKDLENDVKSGKISFAEGLAKSGLKPLSRKQVVANLKQRGKDKKEALADNKRTGQLKASVAAAGRRNDRDIAEGKKAETRKKAAAQAAKDKMKQLELVDKNLDRDAKGGGSENKSEDLLKELVAAAKTTNSNEDKMIKTMETAGGLA